VLKTRSLETDVGGVPKELLASLGYLVLLLTHHAIGSVCFLSQTDRLLNCVQKCIVRSCDF